MQLFVQPTADSFQRALAIAQETTRHHVPGGSAHATNPLIVIALMQPQYQSSLRLRLGGEERSLGQGVRAIAFQELESAADAAAEQADLKVRLYASPSVVPRAHGNACWLRVFVSSVLPVIGGGTP